jgi:acyl-CoA dehydrogenase
MSPSSLAGTRTYDPSPSPDPSILTPVAEHDDLREIVRAVVVKSDDTWTRLMSELEIGTLAVPEALGGAGFGLREVGVVLEETGGALLKEPILTSAVVAVQALLVADDPHRAADVLDAVASGREVAAVAWPSATDAAAVSSNGVWTLHGSAGHVLQTEEADHLVMPASTENGPALFTVDLHQEAVSGQARQVLDETRPVSDISLAGRRASPTHGAGSRRPRRSALRPSMPG